MTSSNRTASGSRPERAWCVWQVGMPPLLVLSESSSLRFMTFFLLYICQGAPQGLFSIAMVPWLLSSGISQEVVGSMASLTLLPWMAKPLLAPLMDAFTCRAYGKRRPWVVATQVGTVAAFLVLAAISADSVNWKESGASDAALRETTICLMTLSAFSATNDVATDGMAIEVLRSDETGRASAVMGAGTMLGATLIGAIGGRLLPVAGLGVIALINAAMLLPVLALNVVSREQSTDRLLPVCEGSQVGSLHAGHGSRPVEASLGAKAYSVLRGLLLDPSTLLLVLAHDFTAQPARSFGDVVFAETALRRGMSSSYYAELVSTLSLVSLAVGIAGGFIIDRVGGPVLILVSASLEAAVVAAMYLFDDTGGPTLIGGCCAEATFAMLRATVLTSSHMRFVAYLAYSMNLCEGSLAAATQYAVLMALSNVGLAIGSALLGAGLFHTPHTRFGLMLCLYLISVAAGLGLVAVQSRYSSDAAEGRATSHRGTADVKVSSGSGNAANQILM